MKAEGITNRPYRTTEGTVSPIFLLQCNRPSFNSDGFLAMESEFRIYDGNIFRSEDFEGEYPKDEAEPLSRSEIKSHGWMDDHWWTETVFFTREEAEAYGKAKSYNYPDGWRVWCTWASGELRKILDFFSNEENSTTEAS